MRVFTCVSHSHRIAYFRAVPAYQLENSAKTSFTVLIFDPFNPWVFDIQTLIGYRLLFTFAKRRYDALLSDNERKVVTDLG